MKPRYPRDKHRQKNIETGRREKRKQTENQKSDSDLGRNTLSLYHWTQTQTTKALKHISTYCSSAVRVKGTVTSSLTDLIFWSRESTETPPHLRAKASRWLLQTGVHLLWHLSCRQNGKFSEPWSADLDHNEGFGDDTGHWLACRSMLEWSTKLCSCAFCFFFFCFVSFCFPSLFSLFCTCM